MPWKPQTKYWEAIPDPSTHGFVFTDQAEARYFSTQATAILQELYNQYLLRKSAEGDSTTDFDDWSRNGSGADYAVVMHFPQGSV